jgi:hypothetical protein
LCRGDRKRHADRIEKTYGTASRHAG